VSSSPTDWRSLSISVPGAKHRRQDRECEDFSRDTGIGSEMRVVALSDGHGSDDVPYGGLGARFAVESAIEVIEDTFHGVHTSAEDSDGTDNTDNAWWIPSIFGGQEPNRDRTPDRETVFRRELEGNSRLVRRVIKRWRDKVRHNRDNATDGHPEENQALVSSNEEDRGQIGTNTSATQEGEHSIGKKERENTNADFKAYGATLLVAAAAPRYRFFFQIGDGDIISIPSTQDDDLTDVNESWVVPADDHLGERTYSLSMERPERYAQTKFISSRAAARSETPFLFLSTDGYRNSFVDDDGFIGAVRDFRDLVLSQKSADEAIPGDRHDAILAQMEHWMEGASQNGSGDDISIGILYDPELLGSTSTHLDLRTD